MPIKIHYICPFCNSELKSTDLNMQFWWCIKCHDKHFEDIKGKFYWHWYKSSRPEHWEIFDNYIKDESGNNGDWVTCTAQNLPKIKEMFIFR